MLSYFGMVNDIYLLNVNGNVLILKKIILYFYVCWFYVKIFVLLFVCLICIFYLFVDIIVYI